MPIVVALLELPEDPERLVAALLPLSAEPHRRRALGFKSTRRRAEFLAGRRMLALLYDRLGVGYRWPDEQPESAPPAVLTDRPVCSTVTHSGQLVLAAVGTEVAALGIDCEAARRNNDLQAVARRHFNPDEANRLARAPEAEQQALFLKHWTLKEAWLKATGQGIGGGFQAVELRDDDSIIVRSAEYGPAWRFWYGHFRSCPLALCWDAASRAEPEFLAVNEFETGSPTLLPGTDISGGLLDCRPPG